MLVDDVLVAVAVVDDGDDVGGWVLQSPLHQKNTRRVLVLMTMREQD